MFSLSRRRFLKFLFALPFAPSLIASCARAVDGNLALVNGTLIDGIGTKPTFNTTIVIDGNRISAVGDSSAIKIPSNAAIIDAKGATILSGFINAHIHGGSSKTNLSRFAQA